MSYEPSGTPWKLMLALVAAGILGVVAVSGYQVSKTTAFRSTLAQCGEDNGLEAIEWSPMHGFDALFIGESFVADTPAKQAAAKCAVEKSEPGSVRSDEAAPGDTPTIEIYYRDSWFEAHTIVFRPASA